jgi:hypothetical protein
MKQLVDMKQLVHVSLAALACLFVASSLAFVSSSVLRASPSRSPASRTWISAEAPVNARSENFQQYVSGLLSSEIQAQNNDHTVWRFHEIQEQGGVRKLYDVVQTKAGNLHRLLALNGKPLTGSAAVAEDNRIRGLANDPSRVTAAQKKTAQDEDQEQSLLKAFPSAFLFRDEGQQGELLKVGFVPNPSYRPSSHEEEVFHHMEGTMVLDTKAKRLVSINGRLTSEVRFWGGLLGHLNAGGTFHVEQRHVGAGHWDEILLDVRMDGKALFFKTIGVRQKEMYSNYQEEPENISLQEAAQQLEKDTSVTANLNGN